jgi:hypothetical protein
MLSDTEKKKALKRLRHERREWIAKAAAAVKTQRKTRMAIAAVLERASATVPQIAAATGIPSHEVLWFIAAMKKYGTVVEDGEEGNYYRYAAVAPTMHSEKTQTGENP